MVLKEYQSKWHLHGYIPAKTEFRTFGIDRISNLRLIEKFDANLIAGAQEEIELFKKRLGSAKPLDDLNYTDQRAQPELIKLWVSSFYLPYLKAKKLHYTQSITNETKEMVHFAEKEKMTFTLVTYLLVPNYELIKVIVSGLGDIVLDHPERLKKYIRHKFDELVQFSTLD